MDILWTLLLIGGLFFLQTNLYVARLFGGISPDLAIVAAIYVGLVWGKGKGTILGFSIGLIQDILSTELLGPQAFSKSIIALVMGNLQRHILHLPVSAQSLILTLATLFDGLCFLFISKTLLPYSLPLDIFFPTFFYQWTVNLLFGIPLLAGILRIDQRWRHREDKVSRGVHSHGALPYHK